MDGTLPGPGAGDYSVGPSDLPLENLIVGADSDTISSAPGGHFTM